MESTGLYIGGNGIAISALVELTGMRFERAQRDRLLAALRDLEPRIVLLGGEGDDSTLAADIGTVRLVSNVPLLALVEDGERAVEALHAGADSVAASPPNLEEVALKVGVLMRLCDGEHPGPTDAGSELELDRLRRRVRAHGEEVELTPTEFRVLSALIDGGGAVLGHLELRDRVWRDSSHAKAEVKLYVSYLRRKFKAIGIDPIETVRGIGYRYCPRPART